MTIRIPSAVSATRALSEVMPPAPHLATPLGCLGGSGRLRGQRRHRRRTGDCHRQPLCLAGGNRPAVGYIPLWRAWRWHWKREKSKQRARPLHYLTGQSLTTVLLLPELLGSSHDSRMGTTQKFHEDAAGATAGRAGEASPTPRAALPGIPPGRHQQSTLALPHLVLRCPQPRAVVCWPGAPALGSQEALLDKS